MRSLTVVLLLAILGSCYGGRILGIFPTPSISHQLPYQSIMKRLAARGHQVTVISSDPLKTPVANYTDIDLSFSYDIFKSCDFNSLVDTSIIHILNTWSDLFCKVADLQLSSPQIQEFIRSNDKQFDVVILEKSLLQSFYGLVHHLGSPPVVGILSMSVLTPTYGAYGNPSNPAYLPTFFSHYTDHMNFWERLHNTYLYLAMEYLWQYKLIPGHEAVMRKHFGSAPPPIYEAEYNDSLLLVDNHWCMSYPRPLLPNVVEITGVHVEKKTNPLPKNIQSFLDGAKHGAIYFSLGSNLRSDNIRPEKVKHILEAFFEVPQRIIWKWESDSLPGKPSNVMVGKWLPQQDILAHPNIRGFIMQGGLQSLQEAAYYDIPVIAIPFMSDQMNNAGKIQASGIGIRLMARDITKETFLEAIRNLLNDSSYRENMKKFADIYREEMGETSVNKAVWWIEYVMRHKGARHLRTAALDLTWYQYLLLDVITVILLTILAILVVCYITVKKFILFIRGTTPASKQKKQKKS